ncbi:MAG: Spy/CpxP family protein refolding chaperone, partial [Phycisphaerales bacterium]|nr:Spy/CpxP family protein refolding chaperone [Phycisphaerales bacterium]
FEPPTPQDVERDFSARRRHLEQLAAIESTYFENLEGYFMGKPQQERLADAKGVRRRAWLDSAASVRVPGMMMLGPMGGRGSSESSIDLVRLAGDTALEPTSVEAIGPVLRQYASNATALQQSRLETVLEGQRQIALFHARAVTRDQNGNVEVSISSDDDGFETMQKADQRIAAATQTVVDLNRSTLEQLESVLAPDQAAVLQAAYDRAAFPAVFRDRGPARQRLESALKLELDDVQRAAVGAIQSEFATAAADIRAKMVAAERAGGERLGMAPDIDGGQLQRVQARANEMRKLRFELSELDARTLQRLATVLSPEQAKAIGGLEPQPDADQSGGIQFLQMN